MCRLTVVANAASLAMLILLMPARSMALPPDALPPEGCVILADGTLYCPDDVYTATGRPIDEPHRCRKLPLLCLPTNPPKPPTTLNDGNVGGHGGHDIDIDQLHEHSLAALKNMSCDQLQEQKDLYKGYVDTDKALLEQHEASLKAIDDTLQSPFYSDSELEYLQDLAEVRCFDYHQTQTNRLEGTTCQPRRGDKPEKCIEPPISPLELSQAQACRDASRDLTTRIADLNTWKARKSAQETEIKVRRKSLDNDRKQLARINEVMKAKKCRN